MATKVRKLGRVKEAVKNVKKAFGEAVDKVLGPAKPESDADSEPAGAEPVAGFQALDPRMML